jgi:hypothetical protein
MDRVNRALDGLSMRGGQGLNFGSNNIDKFTRVGGFSSAPNTRSPNTRSPNILVPKIQQAKDKLSLLWIGCGDKDNLITSSWNLHQGLVSAKIHRVWYVDSGVHEVPVLNSNLYLMAQNASWTRLRTQYGSATVNMKRVVREGDQPGEEVIIGHYVARISQRRTLCFCLAMFALL